MPDREKYIEVLSKTAKEVKELNEDAPIKISLKCIEDILELLKEQKQIPKEPRHFHREDSEHNWRKNEDGEPDEWAWMFDVHNGPVCERCGYSFCEGCKPNGWTDRKCVIDAYMCPNCGRKLDKFQKFCDGCGQAVKWEWAVATERKA